MLSFNEHSNNNILTNTSLETRLAKLLLAVRDMKDHSIAPEDWEAIEETANPLGNDEEYEDHDEYDTLPYEEEREDYKSKSDDDQESLSIDIIGVPRTCIEELFIF